MMQVFRLMGLPDKVIAFDELPKELLDGFELLKAEGFPKYWKNWMGKMKRKINLIPEVDPVTRRKITFDPIEEEDSFFYLVDWNLKPVVEKWKRIQEYVRQNVSTEYRLMDKLEDMAKPLAPDKTSGITLEPDDVVVIPIPKVEGRPVSEEKPKEMLKCQEPGCASEFDDKRAMRMHVLRKHKKEPVSLVASH